MALGTGYLISPRLILTAAHVVNPVRVINEQVIYVGVPGGATELYFLDRDKDGVRLLERPAGTSIEERAYGLVLPKDGQVCLSEDPLLDLALIVLDQPLPSQEFRFPALDLSGETAAQGGAAWSSIGFPKAVYLGAEGQMDLLSVAGKAHLHVPSQMFFWLSSIPSLEEWDGMSGAPVLVDGGHLIGVIVKQTLQVESLSSGRFVEFEGDDPPTREYEGESLIWKRWAGGEMLLAAPLVAAAKDPILGALLKELEPKGPSVRQRRERVWKVIVEEQEKNEGHMTSLLKQFDVEHASLEDLGDAWLALENRPPVEILDRINGFYNERPNKTGKALADRMIGQLLPLSQLWGRTKHHYPSQIEGLEAARQGRPAQFRFSEVDEVVVGLRCLETVTPVGMAGDGHQGTEDLVQQFLKSIGQDIAPGARLKGLKQARGYLERGRRGKWGTDWVAPYLVLGHGESRASEGDVEQAKHHVQQAFGDLLPVYVVNLDLDPDESSEDYELILKRFLDSSPEATL